MKKTIFIVTTLDSGGIENYLLRFLRHFEDKIEPIVICRGNHFGELEEQYRKISKIELAKIDVTKFQVKPYQDFYSFIKKQNADSIVDFTGSYSGILMFLSNLGGVKRRIVFYRGSSHDFESSFFKRSFVDFLKILASKNSTKILSNSIAAFDFYFPNRNINDEKYKVIYNGIDSEKIVSKKYNKNDFAIPENAFVIGHTGRYNRAKNHETILKVAENICAKYENIYFVLCGKNTDVYLEKKIQENTILKDRVIVLGYRDDVSSMLTIFDLYFFPSITEGQPNALIEAMVAGLPIVASNIKPIVETTPEILHGELVSPFDVNGFVDRIQEYYLNNLKRETNNFSDWAKNRFSPNKLFTEFYSEL